MNEKDIWKKYITAQSKILEHKSKPIGIDTTKSVQLNGLKLDVSIDQEIFKQVFKKEVEQIFKLQNFDFESGYIQTSVSNTANITPEQLSTLKELAEICYIDFNENPFIEGTITEHNNNIRDELKNSIGELQNKFDSKSKEAINLTIEEWNKANTIKGVKFDKYGKSRFNIKPSAKFISEKIFQNQYFLEEYNTLATTKELPENVFNYLNSNLNLKIKSVKISLTTTLTNGTEIFQNLRTALKERTKFYPYGFEDALTVILEKKKIRKAGFDSFKSAIENINGFIKNNFNDCEISISTTFFYSYDKATNVTFFDKFLEDNINDYELQFLPLKSNSQFRIDQSFDAIYFDFETEVELKEKINIIKSFPFFDIYYRGDTHKFKFNIKFETGLHELQSNLKKEFPNLNTKLIANGEKLIFRQFYQTGNKTEILARLNNQLNDFIDSESFIYTINDTFQEKYLCEENFELKVEQEKDKLSKLLREEFYFGNPQKEKFYLGKLQKVDYPDLYFVVDEERIEEVKENITEENVKAIFPDLKGEKDKIKRLEDTVLKLDDEKTKLPNDNAKVFLYDSSKAKIIENIDYLLNKTSAEWQVFEEGIFPLNKGKLNDSQKQAIFKTLYAEELALIQGPPGTGKSTAIAEIIWQHIRKEPKQKILLTSETNLAVDNAIDRLKNEENNVVKPIRFGNTENLESEGYFYSLDAIENWQKSNSAQSNTVSHWVNNIANRISSQDDEQIDSALDKWKNHLQKPSNDTKKLFADKYLEYVNLIGATGSSIGKLNSENKWTSFFRSYLNVFEKKHFENKNYDVLNRTKISFDTIIMDEASKATPPELALPVLFGKKSIIVGDHRQLPPMIDGEEIKDILVSIGEKELAKTLSHKEFEISQFERLFKNIDESIKGTFDTQYRMHPAINEAISQFYKDDGGLKCGLPMEETYHNSFDKLDSRYHGLKYKNIMTPETHTIWVNVSTPEIQEGTSRVNFGEIEAICNILNVLKNCEGKNEYDQWLLNQSQEEKQIGMISFYGKQISLLEKMLLEHHKDLYKGKGKEKDSENLIRLSTVSNHNK